MSKKPITKSLVLILWRSLASLNRSVLEFIFKFTLKLLLYKKDSNSYKFNLNGVTFELTENRDIIITGVRFYEVDANLYFYGLKNQVAINKIKLNYFLQQSLANSHNTSSDKNYVKTP